MPYQPGINNLAPQAISGGNQQAWRLMLALLGNGSGASTVPASPVQSAALQSGQGPLNVAAANRWQSDLQKSLSDPMNYNQLFSKPQNSELLQNEGYRVNLPPPPQHSSY